MRYWSLILWTISVGSAASLPLPAEAATQWARDGRSLFYDCEFKQAAHAFEKALAAQPGNAALHYWLGKSYARLAEVSGPLSASKNARKARRSLEQAVQIDPRNREYLQELFDFYVDSPEWFRGGLERAAALLPRIGAGESGAEPWLQRIADSRKEHSGAEWRVRQAVLWTSGAIGSVVPQP
jgi:tetratricopeptide (TPR) repeat protein